MGACMGAGVGERVFEENRVGAKEVLIGRNIVGGFQGQIYRNFLLLSKSGCSACKHKVIAFYE